jgi:hypothetical protein
MPLGWMLALSPSPACTIYQNWTIRFGKPDQSSSNRAGMPRCGSLCTLSEVLMCSRFDRNVRQHILVTPLGNRSSSAMGIYNQGRIWAWGHALGIGQNSSMLKQCSIIGPVRWLTGPGLISFLSLPLSTTTTLTCHPSTPTHRYDTQIICSLLKRIIPMW